MFIICKLLMIWIYGQVMTINTKSIHKTSADNTVRSWNLATTKCTQVFQHPDTVKSFAIHQKYLITGCRDENMRVWDIVVNVEIINTFTTISHCKKKLK